MNELMSPFFQNKTEPTKGCLLALRKIILAHNENISETVKYGMPCFCYGSRPFCYLWIDKKSNLPYLLMVEGQHLHHDFLASGTRAKMKVFTVHPDKDLPMIQLTQLLTDALSLYLNGVIKTK